MGMAGLSPYSVSSDRVMQYNCCDRCGACEYPTISRIYLWGSEVIFYCNCRRAVHDVADVRDLLAVVLCRTQPHCPMRAWACKAHGTHSGDDTNMPICNMVMARGKSAKALRLRSWL
eukprot:scaffold78759_cov35-Tisochrysis_lutea.AAC.1